MANRFLNNIRINDAYTFPASDGSSGQVITTDGAGNLSFAEAGTSDAASVIYRDNFTGDGSTTTFDLQNSITDEDQTQIYIDGVYQEKSTYSISGTTITFTTAPITGHSVEVISISAINTGPTVLYQDNFTGNGNDTAFTLGQTIDNEIKTFIFLNGVYQFKNTYTVDGTTLTFDTAPANGVAIEVVSIASAVQSDSLQAGSVIIPVKNTHTASISKGTPVYITGNIGASERLQIAPADASNSAKMPAAGLLLTTLAVNAEGYVITGGYLRNLTTDTIDSTSTSPNDTVYVKPGGGLTMTKPTGSNLIQNIAKVARSASNSGSLLVSSILRTNDIPNLTTGKIWVGDSNTVESTVIHLDESNNRLGINNTSPSYSLDVTGDANISSNVIVGGNLTVQGTETILNTQTVEVEDNILQLNTTQGSPDTATATTSGISVYRGNGVTQASFIFDDADDTWDLTNNLVVAGNVGIGTTSPNAKLDILGASSDQLRLRTAESEEYKIGRNSSTGLLEFYGTQSGYTGYVFGGVNGTRMTIDSSGNVGIGTGSPQSKLHISTSTTNAPIRLQNDNGSGSTANYVLQTDSSGLGNNGFGIYDVAQSAYRFVINGSGNIGIGTSSPSEDLDISSTGPGIRLTDTTTSGLYHSIRSASDDLLIEADPANVGANTEIEFSIDGTERMRINSSGNVGIGTNSPQSKLHISATAPIISLTDTNSFSDANDRLIFRAGTNEGLIQWYDDSASSTSTIAVFQNDGNVGIGTTSPAVKLHVDGGDLRVRDSGNVSIQITSSNSANSAIQFGDDGDTNDGRIVYENTGDNMLFYTNDSERMQIDSSGNLSLATATSLDFNVADFAQIKFKESGAITIDSDNNQSSRNFQFKDGDGSSLMFIGDDGNVGIGTTNPGAKLDVGGDLRVGNVGATSSTTNHETVLRVKGKNNYSDGTTWYGDYGQIILHADTNMTGSARRYMITSALNNNKFAIVRSVDGNTDPLVNSTSGGDAVNSGTADFVIDNSGRIGIGDTSPGYKLDVNETGTSTYVLHAQKSGTSLGGLYVDSSSNAEFYVKASGNNTRVLLNSDGTSYFNGGNVGIGNTSPNNKLEISDTGTGSGSTHLKISRGADSSAVQRIAGIKMGNTASNDGSNWIIQADSSLGYFDNANLDFIHNSAGTASARIRMGSSGDVLINTHGKFLQGRRSTGSVVIDMIGFGAGTDNLQIKGGTSGAANAISFYDTGGFLGTFYNSNFGIGIGTPQTTLQVNGSASSLNAHFGQGTNGSSGVFGGISLGYSEGGNASYRKVGIVAKAVGDGAARQDLHFLVDTASDSGSAGIADSKMHIQYNTGDVIIDNKLGIGTTSPSAPLQVHGQQKWYTTNADGNELRGFFNPGGSGDDAEFSVYKADGATEGVVLRGAGNTYIRIDSTSLKFINFYYGPSNVGQIVTGGSNVLYQSNSDYRLKENVVEMTGALDRVSELKPSRYNFISHPGEQVDGFMAHELQEVVPQAVSGQKDEMNEDGTPKYQGVDHSQIVPLLVGAIKELKAEIETLKNQING